METELDTNEVKRQARREAEEKKQKAVTLQKALDDYVEKGKLKESTINNYKDLFRTYLADWMKPPGNGHHPGHGARTTPRHCQW